MAGSPFHKDEELAPISDVNVVPLADVSLVLLIILLVLSPMAAQSMLKVSVAAARSQAAPPVVEDIVTLREPEKVLAVGVTPLGFVVDGRLLGGVPELSAWLKPALAGRQDRKVFVSPDLEVEHGRVVAALEAVGACGGSPALVQVVDPEAP